MKMPVRACGCVHARVLQIRKVKAIHTRLSDTAATITGFIVHPLPHLYVSTSQGLFTLDFFESLMNNSVALPVRPSSTG